MPRGWRPCPDNLQDGATADALRAVCELDLTDLRQSIRPKGLAGTDHIATQCLHASHGHTQANLLGASLSDQNALARASACSPLMHYYSGAPMHFSSGVDNWVVADKNPPEIACWESGEWWLAGEAKPWHPEAVTVVSDRLVFKPRLAPVP